jgi:soluble lytic murein transglycosylase-like protein
MTPIPQLDFVTARRRFARTVGWVVAGLCGAMAHAAGSIDAMSVDGTPVATLRDEAASYEHGAGVAKDIRRALVLYCAAARLGDADSQFNLGWIYANGRGVPRDEATASFFFAAAAEQGIDQARRMLEVLGPPGGAIPECMRIPEAAPPAPAAAAPFEIRTSAPKPLIDLVKKMAPAYRVEPQLVLAIIEVESNFDTAALSPKNAKGLMQLIPDTATRFNVKDAYDPKQNIRGGLAYLRWLLAYFEGDLALVAAAYNAGEGTVERYRGVPPYAETRRYVSRILQAAGATVHPYDANVVSPSPRLRAIRTAALGN